MGKFTEILQETYEWANKIKNNPTSSTLERAQFACQAWNLKQMIKIANGIERAVQSIRTRQK